MNVMVCVMCVYNNVCDNVCDGVNVMLYTITYTISHYKNSRTPPTLSCLNPSFFGLIFFRL